MAPPAPRDWLESAVAYSGARSSKAVTQKVGYNSDDASDWRAVEVAESKDWAASNDESCQDALRHKEFARLLYLLRSEHTKLMRENKSLREKATPHTFDVRALDAVKPKTSSTSSQDAADAADVADSATQPEDDVIDAARSWPSAGAAAPTPTSQADFQPSQSPVRTRETLREKVKGTLRRMSGYQISDLLTDDIGTSAHTRRYVNERMEKLRKNGGKPASTFNFPGAARLKAQLKWVRNDDFDYVFAAFIFLNAVYIGVETSVTLSAARKDRAIGGTGQVDRSPWVYGHMLFAALFVFELTCRVLSYQVKFFTGSQRWWNFFDVVTIVAGVTAVLFELLGTPPNFYINFFKVLRLTRLVRSLKSSKSRLFHNLRILSYTVAGSANAFLSAIILLLVVMYVFAVMFMQGVQEYLRRPDTETQALTTATLESYFGDVAHTFFTLLSCITGGNDWKEVAMILLEVDALYQVFFVLYITFTVLCVLNVLNGVFVSVAIESAQTNKQLAIETAQYKSMAVIHQMINWFVEADKDMSGTVSWEEMHTLLKDSSVRNFFMAYGIDVASASQIFTLLDSDGSGELAPDEFVDNLINLQGQAKAIDLASLRKVCDDMATRVKTMEETMNLSFVAAPTGGA